MHGFQESFLFSALCETTFRGGRYAGKKQNSQKVTFGYRLPTYVIAVELISRPLIGRESRVSCDPSVLCALSRSVSEIYGLKRLRATNDHERL